MLCNFIQFMHLKLYIFSYASHNICINHLITCIIDNAYSSYISFMEFCISFIFILCISTNASYHIHLIICLTFYMHLILCIPFYVLNCTHLCICYVYFLVHLNCCWNSLHTNRRTDRPTNRRTDRHCHVKSCYRS